MCDVVSSLARSTPAAPPSTRPGLKSVGYLPESHPAVTERGGRNIKAKGKIIAKRNVQASEWGYSAARQRRRRKRENM